MNRAILLLIMVEVFSGCSLSGRLYTNIVEPLSENFNNTPVGTKTCVIKNYRLREPVSRLNVSAEWSMGYIVEQARKSGITKIYYIDIRTFSVLLDIYRKKDIIIYGD